MAKIKKPRTVEVARQLCQPVLQELGLTLWDLRFEKEGSSWYLRYFIDREGGVSIQDCEAFSRAVDKLLDEADPIEQSYILEVSSPGIERLLREDAHFARFAGHKVHVRLIRPLDGCRDFYGELLGRDEAGVRIRTEEGAERCFPKADCAHVKLHVDLETGGNQP